MEGWIEDWKYGRVEEGWGLEGWKVGRVEVGWKDGRMDRRLEVWKRMEDWKSRGRMEGWKDG